MSPRPRPDIDPSPDLILSAFARRRSREHPTDAFRVLNGPADGAPAGLTLDIYGNWLVLAARSAVPDRVVDAWAEAAQAAIEPDGVVVKTLAENPRESLSRVLGARRPPLVNVTEGNGVFECHLDEGLQTGLFLDHRETRARAAQYAPGVEALNLFAYTCSFSVQAALAGATRVTSVDVSQRSLDWGRRNMSLSGLDPNAHRWFTDDVMAHLKRARHRYGLVILDPPVFGHGKRPFSLLRDLDGLLGGSVDQLDDGGIIIVSSHHLEVSADRLIQRLTKAGTERACRVEVLERLGLPAWDHPVWGHPNELDRGDYLDTVIARVHRARSPR